MAASRGQMELLRTGELGVHGRLIAASNATFQGTVRDAGEQATVVWKPVAGERPLWDFPDGNLARRECAAFVVSEALGWSLVPPTLLREGPAGYGMCQLWIEVVAGAELVDLIPHGQLPAGWLAVLDAYDGNGQLVTLAHADDQALERMAAFDIVVNNADRKAGHILVASAGPPARVYGVDHGVTFHAEPKLRTVLWGFAGRALSARIGTELDRLAAGWDKTLRRRLAPLLTEPELAALRARIRGLAGAGEFPVPDPELMPIPWPPF